MSFIKELKRRNVIKVAIAYAVIAWLLMQVAATAFPALKLPDWTVTLVAALLLIGFPLALIFAWAFELTPEGIRLEKDVVRTEAITHVTGRKLDFIIIGVLAIALIAFAVERFVLLPDTAPASDSAWEIIATEVNQSIAVLPFVNMSDDPGNEYFSDGMSEEIRNLLVRIRGLKVIGRTSSIKFKGKNEDLRVIGQTLGVNYVLEGSVRKSGDRVRIAAQLVDVSDGTHIWSESYDRKMTDIFTVQDDVAAAIFDALQFHVGTVPTRGRPTESTEAYALFLKARVAANASAWRDAEALLLEAVELDPNFAEAFQMLSFVYWSLPADISVVETQRLVLETAAKAIALDPDLVLAQAYYHAATFGPGVRFRAIEAFERAALERPDDPWILEGFTFLLTEYGYLQEALTYAEQYVELDPLSESANIHLPLTLYAAGRTKDAIAALEFVNQSDWGPHMYRWTIEGVNLMENQGETTIAHVEAYLQQHHYPDSSWFRDLVTRGRDPATGQTYLDRRIPGNRRCHGGSG